MDRIFTPLPWREWQSSLGRHPDRAFADFVVNGIKEGFRIGYEYASHRCKKASSNMPSAKDGHAAISAYLAKECAEGRVLGPFDEQSLPQLNVSRLGVVPKHTPGEWRLIVDLSSPDGYSVNDGINKSLCSLQYVSVDTAAQITAQLGRGALMAKVDIRSAYRMLSIHPDDRWLLGMRWEGGVFVETALPFGLRSAPKIFTAVADALEWIVRQEGVRSILHYLDDYLLVGPPGSMECARNLDTLLTTFDRLGVPVALPKLEGPTTTLTFLGIEIDSMALQLRLPQTKLQELRALVASWKERRSCRRKELESLTGKLQHACTVVKPGRSFLRRLFELQSGTRKAHHHIPLRQAARSDIVWWHTFLDSWNGVSLIPPAARDSRMYQVYTDASGGFGCGAIWDSRWFQYTWPPAFEGKAIAIQELLPIVMACMIWGPWWKDSMVLVHCDNQATVCVVNSGYSRDKDMMHLMRCLFFIRAFWGIHVRAQHIPGEQNVVADAISRGKLALLFQVAPGTSPHPSPIPQALHELLVDQQPDWTSPSWVELFRSCLQQVWQTPPRKSTDQARSGMPTSVQQQDSLPSPQASQPCPPLWPSYTGKV